MTDTERSVVPSNFGLTCNHLPARLLPAVWFRLLLLQCVPAFHVITVFVHTKCMSIQQHITNPCMFSGAVYG